MHIEVCVYGGQRLTWGVFSGGSLFSEAGYFAQLGACLLGSSDSPVRPGNACPCVSSVSSAGVPGRLTRFPGFCVDAAELELLRQGLCSLSRLPCPQFASDPSGCRLLTWQRAPCAWGASQMACPLNQSCFFGLGKPVSPLCHSRVGKRPHLVLH